MEVKIISPEGELFKGRADSVILPGAKGQFEVLNSHAPLVSTLEKGDIVIHSADGFSQAKYSDTFTPDEKGNVVLEVSSGVVKVLDNHLMILVD